MIPSRPNRLVTIRAALFVGFGLTFGVWLAAGYYFTLRIEDLESRAASIGTSYVRAQDLLTTAREQLLLGSVYVRDALLDPDPASTTDYRQQAESAYAEAERALLQYVPVLDSPSDRERVSRLRDEIGELRNTMFDVLATDSARPPNEASALLRSQSIPRRDVAFRIGEELQTLNRNAFIQQQVETAALYRSMQEHIWQILGLALLASLGIAVLATAYAGQLERDLRLEQAKDAQNTRDLQRLSAKLTTAQEEERRTIARELHDEVGQLLTAIKVELAIAQRAIQADGGSADVLQDARLIADGAIHTVRDLSRLLHPVLLDDLGLSAALDAHLQAFGRRHDLRVDLLQDRMERRLAPETEAAAYRIIQEALTNVARHAQASECRVYLQRVSNTVLVTIEDNGIGFNASDASVTRTGLGLIGIRERVAQLGGILRIEAAPGKGTRLTVELPAETSAPAEAPADTPASAAARMRDVVA